MFSNPSNSINLQNHTRENRYFYTTHIYIYSIRKNICGIFDHHNFLDLLLKRTDVATKHRENKKSTTGEGIAFSVGVNLRIKITIYCVILTEVIN